MPITIDKAPNTLPDKAKRMYVAAWNAAYDTTCKDKEDRDECASKIAWGAIKRKYEKSGETWKPKSDFVDDSIASFSMYISKAVYNKEDQELRWCCTASDTDPDSHEDNMTMELFSDFLERIERAEKPRNEKYISEFWSGGIPYISLSHYSDQNGRAVPGLVESIYVDGKQLKGKGTFFKNKLGWACFDAINKDKHGVTQLSEDKNLNNPVRISIGFLDYKHRHKSNGEIFERKSSDDVCPWCILESLTGSGEGKEYLQGLLIHLALTRVPVNKRTDMEVQLAMTTRKDDAKSIVSEELVEEIETNETQFRSDGLVTRSESDEIVTEGDYKDKEKMEDEEDETEDDEKEEEKMKSHPLDKAYAQTKAAFDQAIQLNSSSEEKLQVLQPFMEKFAEVIRSEITGATPEELAVLPEVAALRSEVAQLSESVQIIAQMLKDGAVTQSRSNDDIPSPRSIQPQIAPFPTQTVTQGPKSLKQIVNKSVGLDENYRR